MTKIQLSDHFSYKRLLRFTFPSIVMMIFTSIYGIVDGYFISNYAGATPFAAVNLILPFIFLFSAIGFMVGAGGSALVAMTFGTGDHKRANEIFSLLTYVVILLGITISIIGQLILPWVSSELGATGQMHYYCVLYGRLNFISLTGFMLQNMFQSFFVTAEKPHLGLYVTVFAGCTNMILDVLFVGVFGWGVFGAGLATLITEWSGGLISLIYFALPNKSILRLGKPCLEVGPLLRTATNGTSEFLTNISSSFVNMVYNFQLMKLAGETGVAAYGVIMYASFIFCAVFIGYSMGAAPIIGYNHGAENHKELQNIYKKSIMIISIISVVLTIASVGLSGTIARIFVGYDQGLFAITKHAFMLYSTRFLFGGLCIFASAFFTALNNGFISGIISFARVLVLQIAAVLILPIFFGLNGIWLSMTTAEILSLAISIYFFAIFKDKYHY